MDALQLNGLKKRYKDFDLGPLDFTLPAGTICGLVGENGAGKTTIMRLILDIVHPNGGTVSILGQDNKNGLAKIKADIGVVLDGSLPSCMTPPQMGKMMAGIYPNWDAAAYAGYCKRFALPENKKFSGFSRGMQQKQSLAVALSHNAKLLLLDEATNGLDPVVRDEVVELLLNFARDENHSVLVSSHIVSDLEKLCDTMAFLHKGKLLLCEDRDALREEYALWHGTAQGFAALDKAAVYGSRATPYGVEALVRRAAVQDAGALSPVSIEELFVLMVKGNIER